VTSRRTGGRNRRLTLPGSDLPGIYQLRTLAECDAIKAAATPGARAVMVGMGFIGAEVTASLIGLGVKVTALSTRRGPLSAVLGRRGRQCHGGHSRGKRRRTPFG
jgi:3-phenylpropionate/trans-cinnamate dioxygenase ferredoxin reductase component